MAPIPITLNNHEGQFISFSCWQDFNWHSASRGPSAIADVLALARKCTDATRKNPLVNGKDGPIYNQDIFIALKRQFRKTPSRRRPTNEVTSKIITRCECDRSNGNPRKRRHSRWKHSQELKWKITFLLNIQPADGRSFRRGGTRRGRYGANRTAWPLSPVNTSNDVQATLPNATWKTILSTMSIVAVFGNNVAICGNNVAGFGNKVECCFDNVACCFDIVAGVDGALVRQLSKKRRKT